MNNPAPAPSTGPSFRAYNFFNRSTGFIAGALLLAGLSIAGKKVTNTLVAQTEAAGQRFNESEMIVSALIDRNGLPIKDDAFNSTAFIYDRLSLGKTTDPNGAERLNAVVVKFYQDAIADGVPAAVTKFQKAILSALPAGYLNDNGKDFIDGEFGPYTTLGYNMLEDLGHGHKFDAEYFKKPAAEYYTELQKPPY